MRSNNLIAMPPMYNFLKNCLQPESIPLFQLNDPQQQLIQQSKTKQNHIFMRTLYTLIHTDLRSVFNIFVHNYPWISISGSNNGCKSAFNISFQYQFASIFGLSIQQAIQLLQNILYHDMKAILLQIDFLTKCEREPIKYH